MSDIECSVSDADAILLSCDLNTGTPDWTQVFSAIGTVSASAIALLIGLISILVATRSHRKMLEFQKEQTQLSFLRPYLDSQLRTIRSPASADKEASNDLTSDWNSYALYFMPKYEGMFALTHKFLVSLQDIVDHQSLVVKRVGVDGPHGSELSWTRSRLVEIHGAWVGNLTYWHANSDKRGVHQRHLEKVLGDIERLANSIQQEGNCGDYDCPLHHGSR